MGIGYSVRGRGKTHHARLVYGEILSFFFTFFFIFFFGLFVCLFFFFSLLRLFKLFKLCARLSPGGGFQSAVPLSRCATVESSLLSRLGINSSSVENYTWYIFSM